MPAADTGDKGWERRRYNRRALGQHADRLGPDGALGVPEELRSPYLRYEELVGKWAGQPGKRLLDLCCGTGLHSLTAAHLGADVVGLDLAEESLALAKARAERARLPAQWVVGDIENLPFASASFDVVTSAGSMSYAEPHRLIQEITRVLKPSGTFIAVDSFDHNPIYRLNRFFGYLRGLRTFSTLRRMPNEATIGRLRMRFHDVKVEYFGIVAFLSPVLRGLVGSRRAAALIARGDHAFSGLRRHAFKVVVLARFPLPPGE
ncbi:MAG TPA: methyltransferase domain-containing protein [Opitutaceae bacterium]|nr:methyltransferase domain-containing protein [Opitutaceae bacterium]